RARVRDRLTELRAAGRPIARGRAFPEGEGEDSGIEGLDDAISSAADAERTVDLALRLLRRRKLVRPVDGLWAVASGAEGVLRYYARALG
ncbi:MAG TPA: hypothetical protein PLA94_17170, partial [Myxococcota bacterium]|nr:hypothetical protein [Myxococcota bacterium]